MVASRSTDSRRSPKTGFRVFFDGEALFYTWTSVRGNGTLPVVDYFQTYPT